MPAHPQGLELGPDAKMEQWRLETVPESCPRGLLTSGNKQLTSEESLALLWPREGAVRWCRGRTAVSLPPLLRVGRRGHQQGLRRRGISEETPATSQQREGLGLLGQLPMSLNRHKQLPWRREARGEAGEAGA